MAQSLTVNVKGLYTYNSAVNAPSGSLVEAMNLNISRAGIAESRRGFDILDLLPDSADRARSLLSYDGQLFAHYGNTLAIYSSGFIPRGSIMRPPSALSIRSASLNQNLYLSSSEGLKKVDDTGQSLYQAGVVPALMLTAAVGSNGTAVTNNSFVAYRYILCRKDRNNNLVRSAVSSRVVVQNTSGSTKDISLTGYLPSGADTSHFVQVYRSANSTVEPGDELQLCYEYPLTGTDISNGYFAFTDIVPDDLLGDTLYTSPSQQGIVANNYLPPLASDICDFKSHLFFADVRSVHRYKFTVVAVSGTGLAVNDTITISDGVTTEVYTAKAATNIANKEFKIETASSSPSIRIDLTTKALIEVINRASALVYAYSLSTGAGDLPGKLQLEARSVSTSAFTVVSSKAVAFSPQLQAVANVNQTSTNDTYRNGLMFSKEGEVEAVPLSNILFVGSSDDPILRIISLRDALFIFKAKDGAFLLTGDNQTNFSITPLDRTAKLVAPESVCALNGYIYGMFETGLCEVSDSGVSIISLNIKDKFLTLFGKAFSEAKAVTRAIPYETEGKLILAVPVQSSDTYSTYQIVYDVFTQEFCEWNLSLSCGFVNPADNLLYYAEGATSKIRSEKKTFDYTDYSDYQQECDLLAVDGRALELTGADLMQVGDILYQEGAQEAYVVEVDAALGIVTVDIELEWDLDLPVVHESAIDVRMKWTQDFAGNPAGLKNYREVILLFQRTLIREATLSFSTDLNPAVYDLIINGPDAQSAFGYVSWGDGIFGGGELPAPIRKGVPRPSSRANNLSLAFSHRVAYSDFQLQGYSAIFEATSTRVNR